MKKNKKSKNVTSIAIRLNSMYVRDLFFKFIFLNIFLILVLIVMWCVQSEKEAYGSIVINAKRAFDFYPFQTAHYTVVWDNGQTMVKDASSLLYNIRTVIIALGIVEIIYLLKQILFGTGRARKILKPLNEIVETANRLSEMAVNEEQVQHLEDAISKINTVTANEKVYIGDSELRGLEDAINNLLDRMRESYRQQARFVSDASHELRTPISVIQGYANMLDRWGKNDESILEESIAAIKSESENMKNLVEQLLFLARGINGKTQISNEEFLLNDMINEVLEESKMIDKNHIYKYFPSEGISIYGDIGLLKQTARILVENAVRYTDDGEEIIFRTGINEKEEAYFSVQDNGIGMEANDVSHIFERFFRADAARVRKDGGTGLGLSIAKWIIDNHKGYFSVLSRKELGTRITVYLPQAFREKEKDVI